MASPIQRAGLLQSRLQNSGQMQSGMGRMTGNDKQVNPSLFSDPQLGQSQGDLAVDMRYRGGPTQEQKDALIANRRKLGLPDDFDPFNNPDHRNMPNPAYGGKSFNDQRRQRSMVQQQPITGGGFPIANANPRVYSDLDGQPKLLEGPKPITGGGFPITPALLQGGGGNNFGFTGQDVPPTGIANDPVLTNGNNTGGYFDTSGGANTYGQTPTGQGGGGLDYSGMSPSTGGLDTGMGLLGLGSLFTGGSLQDILGGFGQYYQNREGIDAAYGSGEAGFNLAEQVGQRAAEGSEFKPYTVTSNLAQVETDPRGGYNVNLSPAQRAMQEQALGQAGQFFGQVGDYDPSLAAQRGAMGGLFGQALGQYGQPTGLEGLTQAGISGAQEQFGRAGQPYDLNQLRGQFAGQVGSYLGQQPNEAIGGLGDQALQLGSQGLGQYGQGQEGFRDLQGLLTSQAGSRLQDSASTLPTDLATQAYGLGSAGLGDVSAPTDIEALRSQYAGLAGQAGQGLLMSPEERQADIYQSIRATQTPEEERQRLALEERMLAQGRTGVSSAAYGGASPELLAMETARQEAMARAGLSARQQAMTEQQQGVSTAQALTGLTTGLAGSSSDIESAAQSRATQLSQLGLNADQIQSQLESEGLSRGLQTTQAAGQMAGIMSDLDTASQARATQLSNLGLSAEQIESQLQSEGLSRATTAGTTAGNLAGMASDLETAGIGRGTTLANLGLTGTQASNIMGRQQLEDLLNLQRSDQTSATIQQALQQGRLGLGSGMMEAGYMPQQQALELLRQSQVPAQFSSLGRLQGADLQAQLGTAGIESLMQGSQLANELRQQQLASTLQSAFGSQNPVTGGFENGLIEMILGGLGGLFGGGGSSDDDNDGGSYNPYGGF